MPLHECDPMILNGHQRRALNDSEHVPGAVPPEGFTCDEPVWEPIVHEVATHVANACWWASDRLQNLATKIDFVAADFFDAQGHRALNAACALSERYHGGRS